MIYLVSNLGLYNKPFNTLDEAITDKTKIDACYGKGWVRIFQEVTDNELTATHERSEDQRETAGET